VVKASGSESILLSGYSKRALSMHNEKTRRKTGSIQEGLRINKYSVSRARVARGVGRDSFVDVFMIGIGRRTWWGEL
jgi:hypothetical protein